MMIDSFFFVDNQGTGSERAVIIVHVRTDR